MSRADYVSQVGLACIGQRRWNANDDDIGLIDSIEGRRGLEPILTHLANRRIGDVANIALSTLELGYLNCVKVKPQNSDPVLSERTGQGKTDIA